MLKERKTERIERNIAREREHSRHSRRRPRRSARTLAAAAAAAAVSDCFVRSRKRNTGGAEMRGDCRRRERSNRVVGVGKRGGRRDKQCSAIRSPVQTRERREEEGNFFQYVRTRLLHIRSSSLCVCLRIPMFVC